MKSQNTTQIVVLKKTTGHLAEYLALAAELKMKYFKGKKIKYPVHRQV